MGEKKIVNKLVLVGNGFDLALGLKTSYEDFLLWYFKTRIFSALKNNQTYRSNSGDKIYHLYEDELFTVYSKRLDSDVNLTISNITKNFNSYQDIKTFIKNNPQKLYHSFKSKLFRKIYEDSIKGWVDIEEAYFYLLKEAFRDKNDNVVSLNKDLITIKTLLHEYLKQLDYSNSESHSLSKIYLDQFTSQVKESDLIVSNNSNTIITTEKIYFLNFNYTNTINNLINNENSGEIDLDNWSEKTFIKNVCHVHGNLNAVESMIFGYGDEMDTDYKSIEDSNHNQYFEGIKSFKYAENGKYRDLLRFLNSDDYQVVIYGHSCGLSDRVMLNEIFEHDNCKSIKIHFYDKQEFINKTMDISRHFKSNQLMRKKIVEFDEKNRIPQAKEILKQE